MPSSEQGMSTTVVYVMFGLLLSVATVVAVALAVANWKKNKRRCCCSSKRRRGKVTQQEPNKGDAAGQQSQKYEIALEDHLDLVASPEGSISEEANAASLRPLTAASVLGRRLLVAEEEEGERVVASGGMRMEFLPENNTVILIEGTESTVTRITRTSISFAEKLRQTAHFSHHRGVLDCSPVCVNSATFAPSGGGGGDGRAFIALKESVEEKDRSVGRLTQHPRFVRYLGTCFDPGKRQVHVLTDFIAGCNLLEMRRNPELASMMGLTELEKIQVCVDLAEAVYFLHGHSKAFAHGGIGLSSVVVDGETHRARLVAREAADRMEEIARRKMNLPYPDQGSNNQEKLQERAPEEIAALLDNEICREISKPSVQGDIWSLGATIASFLLDEKVWDFADLSRRLGATDGDTAAISKSLSVDGRALPSILSSLASSDPRLGVLSECLRHSASDRPAATYVVDRMKRFQQDVAGPPQQGENRAEAAAGSLFSRRSNSVSPLVAATVLDPLIRQQIEWNVKQDAGNKRRAILFGIRDYTQDGPFRSLSVSPANDVRDLASVLATGGYAANNVYENLPSSRHFQEVVKVFVQEVNREAEEIEILLLYFSGRGVQGLPSALARRSRAGVFSDRVGVCHDLALAAGADGTLAPVAQLQDAFAALGHRVRRKLIILDCRIEEACAETEEGQPSSSEDRPPHLDWDPPVISERTVDNLTTMFTVYPRVSSGAAAASAAASALDSHPRRTNGFLTGCLVNVLRDYRHASVEELPRLLADEMLAEASSSAAGEAFRGVSCAADFVPPEGGVDVDIWAETVLEGEEEGEGE